MSSQFLPVFASNFTLSIQETLPDVISGNISWREMLSFCRNLRARGICSLLLEGIPENFYRDLQKSGRALGYFLDQCGEDRKATGLSGPFFDSVAANDFEGARLIAARSRQTWNADKEYEEDFLYYLFLMEYFAKSRSEKLCANILGRYESVVDGAPDCRMDMCIAFLEGDNDRFEESYCDFLTQEDERYRKFIKGDSIAEEFAATEAQINVEGLGLIRLAEERSFSVQEEYLFVPSIARRGFPNSYDADDWRSIN